MTKSNLRSHLRERMPLLGTFVQLPSADVAEIVGLSGLDVAIIDLEHAPKDWATLQHMIRAVEVAGASAVVRVSAGSATEILRVLELGASGVVVPFIESADDARRVRDAARYAPVGRRGTCTVTRAAQFGLRRADFWDVARRANEFVALIAQIESLAGVENIDEILAVEDGFDGYIVGRSDLASDLGHPGEVEHPAVIEAVDVLVSAITRREAAALGVVSYSVAELARWTARGATLSVYAADTALLAAAYSGAAEEFRRSQPR